MVDIGSFFFFFPQRFVGTFILNLRAGRPNRTVRTDRTARTTRADSTDGTEGTDSLEKTDKTDKKNKAKKTHNKQNKKTQKTKIDMVALAEWATGSPASQEVVGSSLGRMRVETTHSKINFCSAEYFPPANFLPLVAPPALR